MLLEWQGEELNYYPISRSYIKRIDVTKSEEAITLLKELIQEMGGMDLIVISSGVGFINPELVWKQEKETIDVNILQSDGG